MISSQTNFTSDDGNIQYSVKYSEQDGYIEITESRLDCKKKTQVVHISINTICKEEMDLFCQTLESAKEYIYPEYIEEEIEEDYE